MICLKCGSGNVFVQGVTETKTKHRGCVGWFFWILLACITFGLILITPLLTNSRIKSKTRTMAFCQNCGHHWRV